LSEQEIEKVNDILAKPTGNNFNLWKKCFDFLSFRI